MPSSGDTGIMADEVSQKMTRVANNLEAFE